jgi:hypothetical protein
MLVTPAGAVQEVVPTLVNATTLAPPTLSAVGESNEKTFEMLPEFLHADINIELCAYPVAFMPILHVT